MQWDGGEHNLEQNLGKDCGGCVKPHRKVRHEAVLPSELLG